jgi:hypothetical protein
MTASPGLSPGNVEELAGESPVDESDEIEGSIARRARIVALLISAVAMGVVILIAVLLSRSISG